MNHFPENSSDSGDNPGDNPKTVPGKSSDGDASVATGSDLSSEPGHSDGGSEAEQQTTESPKIASREESPAKEESNQVQSESFEHGGEEGGSRAPVLGSGDHAGSSQALNSSSPTVSKNSSNKPAGHVPHELAPESKSLVSWLVKLNSTKKSARSGQADHERKKDDHHKLLLPYSRAVGRGLRISARKARLVADLVRGKELRDAHYVLQSTNKKAAKMILKLLHSALANARSKSSSSGVDAQGESLSLLDEIEANNDFTSVIQIHVDEGPTMGRWRPRAQGRASPIRKRTCHISLNLALKRVEKKT